MNFDDLRRIATGRLLFTFDSVISPRLVPLFYGLGLAAIGVWVIAHFVGTFSSSFGEGVWGLIEIAVFAPLMVVALRILSEAILTFFKANQAAAEGLARTPNTNTLLDEVSAALRDLAEHEEGEYHLTPATEPAPLDPSDPGVHLPSRPGLKRTARRTPSVPPKADTTE